MEYLISISSKSNYCSGQSNYFFGLDNNVVVFNHKLILAKSDNQSLSRWQMLL